MQHTEYIIRNGEKNEKKILLLLWNMQVAAYLCMAEEWAQQKRYEAEEVEGIVRQGEQPVLRSDARGSNLF